MKGSILNWLLFLLLSFIWGSSFFLIKGGLAQFSAFQVASLRIISSALVLLPAALKAIPKIPPGKWGYIFLSGLLGSLIPAYLFCMAEKGIDSALAGMLNSMTPIFVLILGALFFHLRVNAAKIAGILLAFSGSVFLFLSQPGFSGNSRWPEVLMVVAATFCYGLNVNLVHRQLKQVSSTAIAALALCMNAIPALLVLWGTGFQRLASAADALWTSPSRSFFFDVRDPGPGTSLVFAVFLGIFGTALASILFYILIKRAGAVFSSLVTYGIPFVAMGWGVLLGEAVGWKQAFSLLLILGGVYLANRPQKEK